MWQQTVAWAGCIVSVTTPTQVVVQGPQDDSPSESVFLRVHSRPPETFSLLGARPSYSNARLRTCSRLRLGTRSLGWGPTQNSKRYPPTADQQQRRSQHREEVRKGSCEEWGVEGQEDPSPLGERSGAPNAKAEEDEARRVEQESHVEDAPG
jgi:hypothetical protein